MLKFSRSCFPVLLSLLLILAACSTSAGTTSQSTPISSPPTAPDATSTTRPTTAQPTAQNVPSSLLQPSDLIYLGAFRLPDDAPDEIGWLWSGEALTYYPNGDPGGPDDDYPGSLFGTGHNWNQYVSEISIPTPIISTDKNVDDLNTASTLQPFQDIRQGMFDQMEIPRASLEYLPPQGGQNSGKLYFSQAPHLDEGATNPSHGWAELELSNPRPAGPWRIGDYWNYVTTDYLFAIPPAWADSNAPGILLATGRFRDGGQGSLGPSLFAIAPWSEGNPPAPGSTLPAIPLLLYGNVYEEGSPALNGYHHSDHWAGGAWLTAGNKAAVIFVGTKGQGKCWYGFGNGVVWPEEGPYPEVPAPPYDARGWWSSQFVGQILFYNPDDLAAVARGQMAPGEPQPYAVMEVDEYLFGLKSEQQLDHLGAAAFDRERGLLYVLEPFGDGEKPLVHVWRVGE